MVRAILLAMLIPGLCCAQADNPSSLADSAWAQRSSQIVTAAPSADAQAMAEKAKQLQAAAAADPQMQSMAKQAQQIVLDSLRTAAGGSKQPLPVKSNRGDVYRLFISQSLPEATVRAIMDVARANPQVVVEVRGFTAEQTLGAMVRWVRAAMAADVPLQSPPDVEIDPQQFTRLKVTRVPFVALYRDGKPIAWAHGSYAVDAIKDKVSAGDKGDLGTWGQTYQVLEEDLIERMQRNMDKIDFHALVHKAQDDFWKDKQFEILPAATQHARHYFDPSFVVNQDIRLPNGTYLAHQGDRINPLDRMPFSQALIAFDPTSKDQLATVEQMVRQLGHRRRVTIMATQVPRDQGMNAIDKLTNTLGWPVYLLAQGTAAQFHIERVPSLVVAEGRRFLVEEFQPGQAVELKDEIEVSNVDTHAQTR